MEFEDEGLNLLSNNIDGLRSTIDVMGNTLIDVIQALNPNLNIADIFQKGYARKFVQMTGIYGETNKSAGAVLVTKYNRGQGKEEWRVTGVRV